MKHRHFGHKPWPSSANSEGHVTPTDYVTGDEESASVPGPMCWTDWNGAPFCDWVKAALPFPIWPPLCITTSVLLKEWRASLQFRYLVTMLIKAGMQGLFGFANIGDCTSLGSTRAPIDYWGRYWGACLVSCHMIRPGILPVSNLILQHFTKTGWFKIMFSYCRTSFSIIENMFQFVFSLQIDAHASHIHVMNSKLS